MPSTDNTPLVSILIPCKNADLYLDECIASIVSQSYTNWELIIVNDHSTDNSWDTIGQWADKHVNIITLQNNGTGIISALRLAYSIAKGQLITRMDADDIMTPNKIGLMASQLIANGPGNISTGKVEYFRNDKPLGGGYLRYADWLNALSTAGNNFNDIYKECVIASPCWMLYRDDLATIGAFESNVYPEDYDLVFRMHKYGLKVLPCSDEILHLWRDHGSRASRTDDNYKDNRFLKLKVDYFHLLNYNLNSTLILWGAGTKAKSIAKMLIYKELDFRWITNNNNKIGHNIYGKILSSTSSLSELYETQIILAVANPAEQNAIKNRIESFPATHHHQSYWFC